MLIFISNNKVNTIPDYLAFTYGWNDLFMYDGFDDRALTFKVLKEVPINRESDEYLDNKIYKDLPKQVGPNYDCKMLNNLKDLFNKEYDLIICTSVVYF